MEVVIEDHIMLMFKSRKCVLREGSSMDHLRVPQPFRHFLKLFQVSVLFCLGGNHIPITSSM